MKHGLFCCVFFPISLNSDDEIYEWSVYFVLFCYFYQFFFLHLTEISCPDYVNLKDLDPNLFITYERLSSSSNVQQQQQQQQNDMDFDNDFFSHSLSSLSSGHHHDHHGHHNNHHLFDRQALRFRCPIGYRLIGSSLIKCDHKHNEWSETFPKCQRKYPFIYSFIQ